MPILTGRVAEVYSVSAFVGGERVCDVREMSRGGKFRAFTRGSNNDELKPDQTP
jgi:hypothetical protein